MIFEHVDGGLRLTIDDHSRKVVVHLLGELRQELEAAKAAAPEQIGDHMKRLFPSAYHDDAKLNGGVSSPQREVYDYLGWLLHATLDELQT